MTGTGGGSAGGAAPPRPPLPPAVIAGCVTPKTGKFCSCNAIIGLRRFVFGACASTNELASTTSTTITTKDLKRIEPPVRLGCYAENGGVFKVGDRESQIRNPKLQIGRRGLKPRGLRG